MAYTPIGKSSRTHFIVSMPATCHFVLKGIH